MTALLTDNLPLLAGAPNGIKKLRELILELAVRGKLVPQDPSDEPASELLRRIAEEKARLVAEGKIKKQKLLTEITPEEKPFDLPVNWEWVRVAAVGHDWGQKTPNQEFTYIDVGSVDNAAGLIRSPQVVAAEDAPSRARKVVRPGTVIYSTIRPYLLNVAVIDEQYEQEPIASTAFAVIHPYLEMPSQYFLWYLRSPVFVRYVESVQMGIAYPAINDGQFFSGLISLPPLAEQHRIVAKVDELMALCDRLEAQQADAESAHAQLVQALLDSLTQTSVLTARDGGNAGNAGAISGQDFATNWQRLAEHFHTLFTTEPSIDALKQTLLQLAVMGKLVSQDPADESPTKYLDLIANSKEKLLQARRVKYRAVTESAEIQVLKYEIPATWLWMPFRDAVFFQEGPGIRNWQFKSEGVKLLNVSNIGFDDRLDLTSSDKHVSHDEFNQKYQHFLIEEGDLLFAGSGASWGKVAWYKDPGHPVILNTSTMRLCFFCSKFSAGYLFYFTKSNFFREQLVPQLAGLQPNFGSTHLSRIYIPVPPIAEQHRIVAKVDQLMALCDQLKTRLTQARQLNQQLASTLVEQAVA